MRRFLVLGVLSVGSLLLSSDDADACTPAENFAYEPMPSGADSVPPTLGEVSATVRWSPEQGTCTATGVIVLSAAATDDRTSSSDLGLELTVTGELPTGVWGIASTADGRATRLDFDAGPVVVRASPQGIVLYFSSQEAFSFELDVRAIDNDGNKSQPTLVEVAWAGESGGCQSTGHTGSLALTMLALGLATRWARRA